LVGLGDRTPSLNRDCPGTETSNNETTYEPLRSLHCRFARFSDFRCRACDEKKGSPSRPPRRLIRIYPSAVVDFAIVILLRRLSEVNDLDNRRIEPIDRFRS
jgi:hypothetical protein